MPRMKKGSDGLYRMSFSYEGKQYSVRSKDPKQLTAKMTAKLKELSSGVKIVDGSVTVSAWGQEWIDTYKSGISRGSEVRLKGLLSKYINPVIGYMKINQVRPVHCQRVLNEMEGLSGDTITKCRNLLFNIFESAVDNSLCIRNPAKNLSMPRTAPKATHRSITDRERVILLETAKTHPAGLWVLLLLYTGLRPGESLALTGADIVGGYVRVNKAVDRYGEIKEPKSKAGIRKVPIIPALQAVLPKIEMGEPLFKNAAGNIPSSRWIARQWKSFVNAMKTIETNMVKQGYIPVLSEALPPLEPYDLRHTYCTDLERAGVPINVASKLMGHADVSITSKIYTHTGTDVIDKAGEKLAAFTDIVTDIYNAPENALNRTKSHKTKNTETGT